MIGLSLSFCVRDIADGLVRIEDAPVIIAGTKNDTPLNLVEAYRESYWRDSPDKCEAVFWQLWNAGRIFEPRCHAGQAPNIIGGHWLDAETGRQVKRLRQRVLNLGSNHVRYERGSDHSRRIFRP